MEDGQGSGQNMAMPSRRTVNTASVCLQEAVVYKYLAAAILNINCHKN